MKKEVRNNMRNISPQLKDYFVHKKKEKKKT